MHCICALNFPFRCFFANCICVSLVLFLHYFNLQFQFVNFTSTNCWMDDDDMNWWKKNVNILLIGFHEFRAFVPVSKIGAIVIVSSLNGIPFIDYWINIVKPVRCIFYNWRSSFLKKKPGLEEPKKTIKFCVNSSRSRTSLAMANANHIRVVCCYESNRIAHSCCSLYDKLKLCHAKSHNHTSWSIKFN